MLDWWVRETDGGHGRVTFAVGGRAEWVHAESIRPRPSGDSFQSA